MESSDGLIIYYALLHKNIIEKLNGMVWNYLDPDPVTHSYVNVPMKLMQINAEFPPGS